MTAGFYKPVITATGTSLWETERGVNEHRVVRFNVLFIIQISTAP